MGSRVCHLFDDTDDFEQLLEDAERQASTKRDQDFVSDMRDKYECWGIEMFLSESQRSWLERIAR